MRIYLDLWHTSKCNVSLISCQEDAYHRWIRYQRITSSLPFELEEQLLQANHYGCFHNLAICLIEFPEPRYSITVVPFYPRYLINR